MTFVCCNCGTIHKNNGRYYEKTGCSNCGLYAVEQFPPTRGGRIPYHEEHFSPSVETQEKV